MKSAKSEPEQRLARLQAAIKRRGLDAMIVFDRVSTLYLTGFKGSLSYLAITPRSARLFVDGRYIEVASRSVTHCEVRLFKQIDKSLKEWQKEFAPRRVGLEGSIAWNSWQSFTSWMPGIDWQQAGQLVLDLRLIKSAEEVRKIETSAHLNDDIYATAVAKLQPGMREIDVRNVIRAEADRRQAEGQSFDCIVASGPNGSMPHYVPSEALLNRGDMLLIDMGMLVDSYCSDMTRVVALGAKPKARMQKAFDAVLEAEQAALKEVGPGVKTADLHRIATETLKKRGLARYFTHGLGHGVGMEIHEAPRLNSVSKEVLEPGMVITIEPGVYLPGLGGVRIEDLVAVTKSGHKVLSRSPREFRVVPFGE